MVSNDSFQSFSGIDDAVRMSSVVWRSIIGDVVGFERWQWWGANVQRCLRIHCRWCGRIWTMAGFEFRFNLTPLTQITHSKTRVFRWYLPTCLSFNRNDFYGRMLISSKALFWYILLLCQNIFMLMTYYKLTCYVFVYWYKNRLTRGKENDKERRKVWSGKNKDAGSWFHYCIK